MKRILAASALMLAGCAPHHARPVIALPVSPVTTCPATANLCVSADQLPADATHAMFGPLRREYGSAVVRVCNQLPNAVTVPLAYIESQYTNHSGVTVMPSLAALAVIAHSQANTKTAIGLKVGLVAVESAAAATQLASIGAGAKAILTETALGGASLLNILQAAATSGSMLQYSSVTLPEQLQFQAAPSCVSGVMLDHFDSGAPGAGSISFGVSLPGK
jgi:hypothetical protein